MEKVVVAKLEKREDTKKVCSGKENTSVRVKKRFCSGMGLKNKFWRAGEETFGAGEEKYERRRENWFVRVLKI